MPYAKEEIIVITKNNFAAITATCSSMDEELFFKHPGVKWSVAENVQRLIIATRLSTLAYTLPLFLVRLIGGTQPAAAMSYDELALKYKTILAKGAKAGKLYTPKPMALKYGKEMMLSNWANAPGGFVKALSNVTETRLDNYAVKHPLLGRISLRELGYFTAYHTEHHLSIIKNRLTGN